MAPRHGYVVTQPGAAVPSHFEEKDLDMILSDSAVKKDDLTTASMTDTTLATSLPILIIHQQLDTSTMRRTTRRCKRRHVNATNAAEAPVVAVLVIPMGGNAEAMTEIMTRNALGSRPIADWGLMKEGSVPLEGMIDEVRKRRTINAILRYATITWIPNIGKPCGKGHYTEVRTRSRSVATTRGAEVEICNAYAAIVITLLGRTNRLEKKWEKAWKVNGETIMTAAQVQSLVDTRTKGVQVNMVSQTSPRTWCTSLLGHQCRRRDTREDMWTMDRPPTGAVVVAVKCKGDERIKPAAATFRLAAMAIRTQGTQRRPHCKQCWSCRNARTRRRSSSRGT